jgi:hypothetical protein
MRPAPHSAPPEGTSKPGGVTWLIFATLLGIAVLVGIGGCATAGGAPGTADRNRLVGDLANRLSRSGRTTYTAVYTLPGGNQATIVQAQAPPRVAYTYPGGSLILTPEQAAECRAGTCTLTPPPSAGTDPGSALPGALSNRGLVSPALVANLLTAAALDTNVVLAQHDTTIAGENATCVDVSGVDNAAASQFSVCITTSGLLGTFTGQVSGAEVDISLDRYSDTAAPDAFDLPTHVRIVDRRPARPRTVPSGLVSSGRVPSGSGPPGSGPPGSASTHSPG